MNTPNIHINFSDCLDCITYENYPNKIQSETNHCVNDLYCIDFTQLHYDKFVHPLRDNYDEYFSIHLKNCKVGGKCKNFEIISNNNFICNRSHFFCDDIWKTIIGHIMESCYYIKCYPKIKELDYFGYKTECKLEKTRELNSFKYASILSKLLITSKMFQKILNTNLFSVDDWCEESNVMTYNFKGRYLICDTCCYKKYLCSCYLGE